MNIRNLLVSLAYITIIVAIAMLSGCASYKLPEVSGSLVEYTRKDPLGGTKIVAKGVEVTATDVTAAEVTWDTTYPQWSINVRVVDYKRHRETPSAAKP